MATAIFMGTAAGLKPAKIERPRQPRREIIMYGVWLKVDGLLHCGDIRHIAIKDGRLTGLIRVGRGYRRVMLAQGDRYPYQWECAPLAAPGAIPPLSAPLPNGQELVMGASR